VRFASIPETLKKQKKDFQENTWQNLFNKAKTGRISMNQKIKFIVFFILLCAIALSLAAHFFAVFPFDITITSELQEVKNPVFSSVMQGVSAIGGATIGILMTGAVAALFIFRGQMLEAAFILITLSNFVLTSALKVLVARPRPPYFEANPADTFHLIDQYSFPSGHVIFFIVFFGFIAYLAWFRQTGWTRLIVITVCGALIIFIGPSRVYLGAHWASDILGSYIFGILWLLLLILGYELVSDLKNRRLKENRNGLF